MRQFDNSYGTEKYILPLLLDDPDYETRQSVSNMFAYLDDFMNTLMIQLDRISASNEKLHAMANRSIVEFEERLCFTTLWADYYFFLNTVERTYRLAMELYKKLGEPEKAQSIRRSQTFDDARLVRNMIEHLAENVSEKRPTFYEEHRSMAGNNEITIDGKSFEASEDSLQILYQIYDDISNIIANKYIVPNKDVVDRIWTKKHPANTKEKPAPEGGT